MDLRLDPVQNSPESAKAEAPLVELRVGVCGTWGSADGSGTINGQKEA